METSLSTVSSKPRDSYSGDLYTAQRRGSLVSRKSSTWKRGQMNESLLSKSSFLLLPQTFSVLHPVIKEIKPMCICRRSLCNWCSNIQNKFPLSLFFYFSFFWQLLCGLLISVSALPAKCYQPKQLLGLTSLSPSHTGKYHCKQTVRNISKTIRKTYFVNQELDIKF